MPPARSRNRVRPSDWKTVVENACPSSGISPAGRAPGDHDEIDESAQGSIRQLHSTSSDTSPSGLPDGPSRLATGRKLPMR